jgi:hypothetical protein
MTHNTRNVSDIRAKLRSRLLSTDFAAWNNPRRVKASLPVFVVLGGGLGILIQSYGVVSNIPLPVLWTLSAIVGVTVLAMID